ncbi:hypothetical protein JS521_12345 [Streptomyces sp. RHZ10]|uniref:Integral membrane protein n=1 Tax=Streptomyces durocortorensis TaxID=2811104 RepID=A0ABS2HXN8_9ACTN|nr:hypothetical protein [Streptomyces durocortorensis]
MKHPGSRPPTGRRRRVGPPPPRRRSPIRWHAQPQSSQGFVLGGIMSVCGLIGGVRALLDGTEARTTLGLLGIGALGLAITVSGVLAYFQKR